ncbi:hypothetical protein [Nocardia pseudovaccinii]|uniref:hypothetical protein n=1 Tax=Nocardia pseudovaccinii TaxID=189540 RepID=UPI000A9ACDF7|nr:hypothetical protein [Nocardia pseudovaccinii]
MPKREVAAPEAHGDECHIRTARFRLLLTGCVPRMLAQRSVTPTSTATHLTYDVVV